MNNSNTNVGVVAQSGTIRNLTLDVDPGYRKLETFIGGIRWYKTESKDFVSNISFELNIQNGKLKSLNGQTITFMFSINEFFYNK